ncbi:HEPN/Toprim-associated domain-containing protein [Rubrolithibacter danxiaensis]|uniref:HEPN/Toprim-associated domain-containing protein n=1 Tax=Rubrolithibacter danxiaensis TaxID=3390805 RepID=UPI003BF85C6C
MGQYCELYISDYPISTTKNEIDPFILSLFQPEDLNHFDRLVGERNQLLYGRGDSDDETEHAVEYSNTAKNIKDRLEIMGFTLKKAMSEFETSKEESIERLTGYLNDKNFTSNPEVEAKLKLEKELLEKSSFNDFLAASKEIIDNGYRYTVKVEDLPKETNPLIFYLLEYAHGFDQFPYNYDQRVLLRSLLELTPADKKVTYDITELIDQEYYEEEIENIYEDTIQNITYDYELGEKFLILTEGSSDIQILQGAMKVLYPHLTGYYSFMDFGISNASGSASSLVASVKSFVGAGIKNRVIALFDNDTAAESALRGFQKTIIPKNIKILQYPNIKIAENYPTLGPSGISQMNINGLACSIELYLGKDILSKDEQLIPVQWKGYDQTLGKYQGEIIDKSGVQKQFQTKIDDCLNDPTKTINYDWTELNELLQTIFNAFNTDNDEN